MSDDEYDYSEPWPMFADEDEPWKDFDRLDRLEGQMDTQKEMAAALGCSPSTISYWLGKKADEYDPEPTEEQLKCDYYEVCGNETPGPNNGLCDLCLDLGRRRSSEVGSPKDLEGDDFTTMEDHMELLYERYSDYVEEFRERRSEDESDDGVTCDECGEKMNFSSEIEAHICPNCTTTAPAEA